MPMEALDLLEVSYNFSIRLSLRAKHGNKTLVA